MSVEELLDLPGVDVLATPDDHVLDPAHDVDVALPIHHAEVAGVHPARRIDRGAGRLLVAPVAEHQGVAPDADLSAGPAQRRRPGGGIHDLALHVGVDSAHRRHPLLDRVVGAGLE